MSRELTKNEITELMLHEMAELDLVNVPFWWDQSDVYLGIVYWDEHLAENGIYEPIGLALSERFYRALEDKWHMVDTLYHEIAHVICAQRYNDPGHGENWVRIAKKFGTTARPVQDFPVSLSVLYDDAEVS